MEYDYADQLDLEWHDLLQRYLKAFSCQRDPSHLLTFEEVLKKVFCLDDDGEQEGNYGDKENCEKFLIESLGLVSNRPLPPRETQVRFLLNVAKYTSKDETCFINLNASNVIANLTYLALTMNNSASKETKILFLELLSSFMEHHSGIKDLIESKSWMHAYKLVLDYQNSDSNITGLGYQFLTTFLEKALLISKEFCYEIIHVLASPLLNASCIIEKNVQLSLTTFSQLIQDIKPSIQCLVEILEKLLKKYSSGVLHCMMQLKIDLASDTVSKPTLDKSVCLVLDRIVLIMSFFKLTDVLDGIKTITQDPLAVTGFLRIVDTETDKGAFDVVFELYYYSLKYLKYVADKLPRCVLKEKNVNIESELVCLQLEPILLITLKLDYSKMLKDIDTDLVRRSHLSKMLNNLSFDTMKLGIKIRETLPAYPFELFTASVKHISRSRNLYSKELLGSCFEGLIYSLHDTIEYFKSVNTVEGTHETALQEYVMELLKAILLFIESFNLNWCDSVKILELTQIVNRGGTAYQWPAPIVVHGFKLLQELISRRLSPAMSLLIDCYEDLQEYGPILYEKCFTPEWEVRKVVLEVVQTIASSGNKTFPSFKTLLFDASLPHLISTMALNDENPKVRASAFKCLQEIIQMEDIEDILPKDAFISKVLDVIESDVDAEVKEEAVKLVTAAYLDQNGLEDKVLVKAYKTMEDAALKNTDARVQVGALEFWRNVTRKHLSNQGWMDKKFPSVTFSKRIVCMTNKEVRKRIYKVLKDLSVTGCLKVFQKMYAFENVPEEVTMYLNKLFYKFHRMFQEYEVTPESMSFNQELINLSPLSSEFFLSSANSDSDQMIQEIINETVTKMIPDDIEFIQDEDLFSIVDARFIRHRNMARQESTQDHQISPSEFVDFIDKQIAYIETKTDNLEEYLQEPPVPKDDLYNIIDY